MQLRMSRLTFLIKSGIALVLLSATYIDGFENLALRRPAWEQHPWPYTDKDYGSHNAVDGDYSDRSAAGGQCSISADNNYTEATWGVDLGEVVSISHINIFYRTDNEKTPTTFTSRMAGFSLYVSNTTSKDDGYLCFHEIQNAVGRPSEDQNIHCPFHARYVIYYNERRPEVVYPSYYSEFAYSDLCEVEVYGCRKPGYFGNDCNLKCPENCQEKRCNITTGYCLGCLPGYKDQSCKHICEKMTYGLECALKCGECRDGTSCHHVNGTCTHGCADGLYGDMCEKDCPIGYYGRNCLLQCSENCYVTSRCDRVTGQCDRGCKEGWTKITCDQKCEIGYFGPDCLKKCGHCLNASFCHHINGSCLNGCWKGFKGEFCNDSCPHGYFGIDCVHKCSTYCSGNGSCSRFTGVCDESCKDGWSGLQCGTRKNTECEIGYFGPDCLKKCGHCFNTSQCNLINGTCLNGCSKGYTGKYCKESCAKGYFGINCVHKCSTYCRGNGSCSHVTGVCDEGCKDGWSGSKCGTSINSEGLNGLIPIIIGIGSGIGVLMVGVVVFFVLSKIRKGHFTKSVADKSVGNNEPVADNIDNERPAQELDKFQKKIPENLTDQLPNPDEPIKHLPRNVQDDTSATHMRIETTQENRTPFVITQHIEDTAVTTNHQQGAHEASDCTKHSKSVGDKSVCTNEPVADNFDNERPAQKLVNFQRRITENVTKQLPNPDEPIKQLSRNVQDDTSGKPMRSPVITQHIEDTAVRSRVSRRALVATQPTQFSGITELAAKILKDNPNLNDHTSQSQSEMKQNSANRHQSQIATTESDGRQKNQYSAKRSDGVMSIGKPESNGVNKRIVSLPNKNVRGNVESENKKKEAEEKNKTNIPKIHKAKPKSDCRNNARYSAPKSDSFGRKAMTTDRKPLLIDRKPLLDK